MPKRGPVGRLERKRGMSWALKAWIMRNRMGYTNKGGHWHKARGSVRRASRRR